MCQFIKSFLEGKWSLILSLVMITGGYSLSQMGINTLIYQYFAKEGYNISALINEHFPIFDEISTNIHQMSPIYQFKHLFGLDHEDQLPSYNVEVELLPKVNLPGDDLREFAGMDRVPATDGWGPYYPILAIVQDEELEQGKYELIPGKLCLGHLGKGRAFYVRDGREFEAVKYAKINGDIMLPGEIPSDENIVGMEWNVNNEDDFGGYYVGAAKVDDWNFGIGKVRNGLLHHGYAGKEIVTDDFVYIQVNRINNQIPREFMKSLYKIEDHDNKFQMMKKKIEAPQDLDQINLELQKNGIPHEFFDMEHKFKKDKNGKVWDGFGRTIGWWESKPMTWDDQAHLAFKKGGKLLTNVEAQAFLKWAGGPIMKQDAWVATYRVVDDGHRVEKDWIQIGEHQCGVGCSHVDTYGYPVWGDKPAKGWNTMMMAFNMKK